MKQTKFFHSNYSLLVPRCTNNEIFPLKEYTTRIGEIIVFLEGIPGGNFSVEVTHSKNLYHYVIHFENENDLILAKLSL